MVPKRKTAAKKTSPKRKAAKKKTSQKGKTGSKQSSLKKNVKDKHHLWQMSRATRQIVSVIDAMPILEEICADEKNTRELQKLFGDKLAENDIKTSGETEEGSGGNRTWMVAPKIFGLFYEDKDKIIKLTPSGKIVAKGKKPANDIMIKQLMTFQWPNRTQEHHSQLVDEKFCIFPYRFLVKLLLKLKYLTVKEIEFFVLPVSSEKELSDTIKRIKLFRNGDDKLDYKSHRKIYKKDHLDKNYKKYVNDLANTFKNHMEFLPGIVSVKEGLVHKLIIEQGELTTWMEHIKKYDKEWKFIQIFSGQDRKFFVDRYGRAFGRTKASSKTSKPITKEQTQNRKIQEAITEILENSVTEISEKQMIQEISQICSFISKEEISKKLSNNPEWINKKFNAFEKKYLTIAQDGEKHEEFESMTNQILKKFGFNVQAKVKVAYTDEQEGEIDTLVTYNSESGVIDEKAGKNFFCGNERVGSMKDYIKEARKISDATKVKFFGYVFGKKFSTPGGFNRICEEMKIDGFRISAANLLSCLDAFDNNKITPKQIWKLFQKNGEITSLDYQS